ncbi:MAG: RNA polymerase sigma factor [Myxococcales bacterium]
MSGDDSALLVAAQSGNKNAIAALLERYQDTVFRFGKTLCRCDDDARDVLQDTLMTVVDKLGDFRGEASFTSWLYAIARSQCSRQRRKTARETPCDAPREMIDPRRIGEDALVSQQNQRAVELAIGALEPIYQETLVLRDLEGLSAPEVARTLGITVDAVKSRLHRARAQLRASLTTAGHAPNCPDVVSMLSRHLEGDLTGKDCAAMEKHVINCVSCTHACNGLKETLALCRQAGQAVAPPETRQAVVQALGLLTLG